MSDDQPGPSTGPGGEQLAGGLTPDPAPATVEAAEPESSTRTARKLVYLVPAERDATDPDENSESAADRDKPAAQSRVGGADQGALQTVQQRTPGTGLADLETDVDLDAASDGDDDGAAGPEHRDWAWVEEWRSEQEPTPWASGLVLTAFSALVVGVAIWVLCAGLADRPVIAVAVNVLVAAGLAPAMWLSRGLPVLRWIAVGALLGVVGGWVAAVVMLPLPLP